MKQTKKLKSEAYKSWARLKPQPLNWWPDLVSSEKIVLSPENFKKFYECIWPNDEKE